MLNTKRMILSFAYVTILFVVPLVRGQETYPVLKPNQLMTFSLAPGREKVFVLQMKKGDFAGIESLASEGLTPSFEVYDSARTVLLDKSRDIESGFSFVAARDGDYILVCKLEKPEWSDITGAQRISIQYNNKFKLPPGTKLKALRKVSGYDVKIMITPESAEGGGDTVLLIAKGGQLQKTMSTTGNGEYMGFIFADDAYLFMNDEIYSYTSRAGRTRNQVQLLETTPETVKVKTKSTGGAAISFFSHELPDLIIEYLSGGRAGGDTIFFRLGGTVQEVIPSTGTAFSNIGRTPRSGSIFFETADLNFVMWLNAGCMACARPSNARVILEFRNDQLRPNFDLMKKPPPPLAVLKIRAQKLRNQLSLKPYKGADHEPPGLLYSGIIYADNEDSEDRESISPIYGNLVAKRVCGPSGCKPEPENPFWDVMIDLIYTGNEELAWQFLDLVWPPQKEGKALFIRDFNKQLLESPYWKANLEGSGAAFPLFPQTLGLQSPQTIASRADTIHGFRVINQSESEVIIEVDYSYDASLYGDRVYSGACLYRNGQKIGEINKEYGGWCGYYPAEGISPDGQVPSVGSGKTRIKIRPMIKEPDSSDEIEIFLNKYGPGDTIFVSRRFPFVQHWKP